MSVIRIEDIAHVRYAAPDLPVMRRFLALLDTPAGRAARYIFSALLVAVLVVWAIVAPLLAVRFFRWEE